MHLPTNITPNGTDLNELGVDKVGAGYCHTTPHPDYAPLYAARYDHVESFSEGLAVVRMGDAWFHIGPNGLSAYEQRYLEVADFWEGFATAKDEKGWFHIKPDGSPAYKARFHEVYDFFDGRAEAVTKNDGKEEAFSINTKGERIA